MYIAGVFHLYYIFLFCYLLANFFYPEYYLSIFSDGKIIKSLVCCVWAVLLVECYYSYIYISMVSRNTTVAQTFVIINIFSLYM